MMEPQAGIDVGNRAIGIFQDGHHSGDGALLARLFNLVICTIPKATTFPTTFFIIMFGTFQGP
jgi:hypothetical protein